jgi:type IV pilus assembly protein PilV
MTKLATKLAKKPGTPNMRRMAGVGLIEILVTLVIFSLGMLSLAALQGIAKKANFDALQRTNAALMAYDLLERMRSNNQALASYVNAGDLGGGMRASDIQATAVACRNITAPCTRDQIAGGDLTEWESILDGNMETRANAPTGGLVDATACINGPVLGGSGGYTVVIAWRGVTAMTNAPADPCGAGLGRYGINDELRRVIVVQTFIGI